MFKVAILFKMFLCLGSLAALDVRSVIENGGANGGEAASPKRFYVLGLGDGGNPIGGYGDESATRNLRFVEPFIAVPSQ